MAVIKPTIDRQLSFHGGAITVSWALANGDTGQPVELAGWSEKTFQVAGTFGAAGSVAVEGSNELVATNYGALANRQGTPMAFTTAGLNTSQDRPRWVRPNCTAGDGTTALVCTLIAHRFDGSVKS